MYAPAMQETDGPPQWAAPQPVVQYEAAQPPAAGKPKRRFPWTIAVIIALLGLCVVCVGGGAAGYLLWLQPRLASTGGNILTTVVTVVATSSDVTVGTPPAAPTSVPLATPVPTSTSTPVPTTAYRDEYGAYTIAYPIDWVVIGETPGEYAFLAESALVSDDLAAGPFFMSLTHTGISDLQTLRQEMVAFYEAYDVRELESVPAQFAGIESVALAMKAEPPGTSAEVQIYALLAIRDGAGQVFTFGASGERWDEGEPLFQQMADSLSLEGAVMQPPPAEPQVASLVFATAIDDAGNAWGVTDVYPPGTTEVYAVFAYEGFAGVAEYEAVFYLDGELDASEPLVLEGDGQGQTWLRRYDDEGLASGNYTLEIHVADERLAQGTFTVLGGHVVLQDDFSDPATGWVTWVDEDSQVWYEGDQLNVLINTEGWMAYPTYAPESGDTFGDLYIEVDGALVVVPEAGGDYGIITRQSQESSYYQFVVDGAGYFKVRKHSGEGWTVLLDWQESDAIRQAMDGANRLQVVCRGPALLFYVNGIFLGQAEDEAFSSGRIGVSAGSYEGGAGVQAVFDNVVVWELE
jgi:hypothetical protein